MPEPDTQPETAHVLRCTCGAYPPPDARFCHKCGRPLFDMISAVQDEEGEAPVLPPPLPERAAAPAVALESIDLRNRAAVRIAITVGLIVTLTIAIPLPTMIRFLWQIIALVAGGFWSVHLYHKRTGSHLSVRNGARMGWLTGVFCFLVVFVLFTMSMVLLMTMDDLRQQLQNMSSPEVMAQIEQFVQQPALLAAELVLTFAIFSAFATVGGALGAKILEKE